MMKNIRAALTFLAVIISIAPGSVSDTAIVALSVFSNCLQRNLPCGWEKFKDTKGISLQRDSSGYFVNITSKNDVEAIGVRITFNARTHQWLHWRWRVRILPSDACENIKKKNDSAAGLYVAFKGIVPFNHVIKYVWSTTLPIGTTTKSPYHGSTRVFVLQSGPEQLNTWICQERNIFDDYRLIFGSDPPGAAAIAIQSDSDDTQSEADADFADIFVSTCK